MDNDHQDLIAENVRLFRRIIELEREQARITAAAEVGEKRQNNMEWLQSKVDALDHDNETIERCARVIEESFTPFSLESLAGAIRALKDK